MSKDELKKGIIKKVRGSGKNRRAMGEMVYELARELKETGKLPEMADYYLAQEIIKEMGLA